MNHQLHTLYRALIDYRKNTAEDRECKIQRTAISSANSDLDVVEITRRTCVVEEDWIEAIERGLEFIEKAIKEERQFIRSNGEIIPIEKVKRTSKDSVEHLARHSDLITRLPEEGKDVIPDSLYTVERLSDYTVYENRFLYMLLCYLRDFISIRYEKILELTNTYNGKLYMNKTIVESNRRVVYEVKLEEEKKNDDYLRENNSAQDAINRMMTIYKAVVFFLNTPLMIEVAKTPMLKPPITRTNVLKMNRNFKEALSLYEYVSAYDKDGYEIKTEIKTLSPFVATLADEIAETVELSSFLTYEYGLNIKDLFKRHYEKEEERRKEEARQKYAEQLNNIRRHIEESGLSPEEYVAMLEKRIKDLEEREEDILAARNTIDALHNEIDRINDELRHSKEKISALKYELSELYRKYEEDMEAERIRHQEEVERLNEEHAAEVQALHEEYTSEIERINEEHADEVERINNEHANEIQSLVDAHQEEITSLNTAHALAMSQMQTSYEEKIAKLNEISNKWQEKYSQAVDKYNSDMKELKEKMALKEKEHKLAIDEKKDEIKELKKKCKRLDEQKAISDARLNAIRSEYGLMTEKDVFSTKDATDEIEHQYRVFKKFFHTEWRKTKKQIRKEVLGGFAFTKAASLAKAKASAQAKKQEEKEQVMVFEDVEKIEPTINAESQVEQINNANSVEEIAIASERLEKQQEVEIINEQVEQPEKIEEDANLKVEE